MGYIARSERGQSILFPSTLDDYIGENNEVRAIAAFIEYLPFEELGFVRGEAATLKKHFGARCSISSTRATSRRPGSILISSGPRESLEKQNFLLILSPIWPRVGSAQME